jgi:AcrR family transcriptional regulator
MPNRSPARSSCDDKLAHILHAAARVIAEKGYDGTSNVTAAGASGVSPAGLYDDFRSKEELIFMIQDRSCGTVPDRPRCAPARRRRPRARAAAAGGEPLAVLRHPHGREEGAFAGERHAGRSAAGRSGPRAAKDEIVNPWRQTPPTRLEETWRR